MSENTLENTPCRNGSKTCNVFSSLLHRGKCREWLAFVQSVRIFWSTRLSDAKTAWTSLFQLAPLGNSYHIDVHRLQSLTEKFLGKLNRLMLSYRQQIHPMSFASYCRPCSLPPVTPRERSCWRSRCCVCRWRRLSCCRFWLWLSLFNWRLLGGFSCGKTPSAEHWK